MKVLTIVIVFILVVIGIGAINISMNAKRIQSDIHTRVDQALKAHKINRAGLKIKVDGRDVVLTGEIESLNEKLRASEVVNNTRGVRKLSNLLKIKEAIASRSGEVDQVQKIIIAETKKTVEEKYKMVNYRIFFKHNSVIPNETSQEILNKIEAFLKSNPAISIEIHGHTSEIGSNSFNQDLSIKRSESIQYFLGSKGVDATISRLFGHGERLPAYVGNDDDNKNRRVDIYIKVRQ